MAFDWGDYLTLAKELRTRNDEAAKRTAISRAYYCVFNKAADYAQRKLNYQYSVYQPSHIPVWKCFEGKGITFKAIRDSGIRLKEAREKADYHSEFANIDNSLTQAIKDAENALSNLSSIEARDN